MITKPMLAASVKDFNKIKFPVLATPKIDGIRCLRINGKSLSRSFKEIPNRWIQEQMKDLPDGLDGEIVVGKNFQETSSGVMSIQGEPDFKYVIFDYVQGALFISYSSRVELLEKILLPDFCQKLCPVKIHNLEQLELYEATCLRQGYEGICIRQPFSFYKCGRSTEREGYLLKIKRFKDAEAVILGLEEQMKNCNLLEEDNFGDAKRSTCKSGKAKKGTLGKFKVRGLTERFKGSEFKIGTGIGLTEELRQKIWNNPCDYLGKIIIYKYQEIGTKDLPRCPIFKGFRNLEDM